MGDLSKTSKKLQPVNNALQKRRKVYMDREMYCRI